MKKRIMLFLLLFASVSAVSTSQYKTMTESTRVKDWQAVKKVHKQILDYVQKDNDSGILKLTLYPACDRNDEIKDKDFLSDFKAQVRQIQRNTLIEDYELIAQYQSWQSYTKSAYEKEKARITQKGIKAKMMPYNVHRRYIGIDFKILMFPEGDTPDNGLMFVYSNRGNGFKLRWYVQPSSYQFGCSWEN